MPAPEYRPRGHNVHALQFTGGRVSAEPIIDWCGEGKNMATYHAGAEQRLDNEGEVLQYFQQEHLRLHVLNGFKMVLPGEWVVKTPDGSFVPILADTFADAYERVS